jgi:hypothetical protein
MRPTAKSSRTARPSRKISEPPSSLREGKSAIPADEVDKARCTQLAHVDQSGSGASSSSRAGPNPAADPDGALNLPDGHLGGNEYRRRCGRKVSLGAHPDDFSHLLTGHRETSMRSCGPRSGPSRS